MDARRTRVSRTGASLLRVTLALMYLPLAMTMFPVSPSALPSPQTQLLLKTATSGFRSSGLHAVSLLTWSA